MFLWLKPPEFQRQFAAGACSLRNRRSKIHPWMCRCSYNSLDPSHDLLIAITLFYWLSLLLALLVSMGVYLTISAQID